MGVVIAPSWRQEGSSQMFSGLFREAGSWAAQPDVNTGPSDPMVCGTMPLQLGVQRPEPAPGSASGWIQLSAVSSGRNVLIHPLPCTDPQWAHTEPITERGASVTVVTA